PLRACACHGRADRQRAGDALQRQQDLRRRRQRQTAVDLRGAHRRRSRRRTPGMKAAVYYETGPPRVFRYEDVPDPTVGPGDVLVDVEAVSIEGGDTLNRAGGEMATSPHIVGYQCAGTIAEVGSDATDRKPGERVVCTMLWGSHAERVAVPPIVTWLVPDDLDIVETACIPVAFAPADDCRVAHGRLQPRGAGRIPGE